MSRLLSIPRTARTAVLAPILVLLVALLTGATQSPIAGTPLTAGDSVSKPTIVLVHGAFADASGWNDVAVRLAAKGYPVVAPPNPLRGLTSDTAYLETFLSTIPGPIVLVGHSYGGAVITNAATGNPDVRALVYVAAYALDEGENVAEANELGGGHSDLLKHIVVRPYPGAPEGDGDVYVDPDAFRSIFAHDLPRAQTVAMAAGQRPATFGALITPSAEPAWRAVPSWYLIAGDDHLIPPLAQAAMAERAGARTRTVDSSHVAMMSHSRATTDMILQAAYATSRSGRP